MNVVRDHLVSTWHSDSLEAAKKLIYDPAAWQGKDGESWEQRTADAIPVILDDCVMSIIPKRNVALEIGCGVGRLMELMAKKFHMVLGVDVSPSMVEFSKQYLHSVRNTSVHLCDGQSIPLPGEFVDFIYSMITFQHIPTRALIQNYLKEARRVLIPGGIVRIQTCRGLGIDLMNGTQGYGYTSSAEFVEDFISAGFSILEVEAGVWHEEHLWVTATRPSA